jgi:O-antigen/teichoic acid export membrane protein
MSFPETSAGIALATERVRSVRSDRAGRLRRWATKGGFAIADQGLISGSNFLLGVFFARWLVPEDYGAYSLAFSIFLLLSIIYQAVLLEPMMVFGGAAEVASLRGYIKALTRIHVILVALMFGGLALSTAIAHQVDPASRLPRALLGASLAGPCVLLSWLYRRAFYLELSVVKAAFGALFYCVVLLCGALALHAIGLMSPFIAFAVMAAAALVTAAVLYYQLERTLPPGAVTVTFARETWRKHWRYGRWAIASSVAGWVPAYVYYPLLGSFSGMAQAGELRALMNFVQPLAQFYAALSPLFLPYAARQRKRDPHRGPGTVARNGTLLFMAVTVAYWFVILLFRTQLFHLLYGGKYSSGISITPIIALGSVLWSGTIGASIVLRAMELPDTIFLAYLAASLVSVVVGVPLTSMYGVAGAVWTMNLADAVALILIVFLIRGRLARVSTAN